MTHTHVTRDIKPPGWGCPDCDDYHAAHPPLPVTCVVHCKREPFDVYIGRPGPWGNPFTIGRHGTREQVIEKYAYYLCTSPILLAALPQLRGKVLGCWCHPLPCHGDVLARLADGRTS